MIREPRSYSNLYHKLLQQFFIFLLLLFTGTILAGIYGILHDQVTYSISPEYYTKFKFYQFRLALNGDEAIFPQPRLYVAIVGLMATWWVGLFAGMILGLVGFVHKDLKAMWRFSFRSILIAIATTIVFGLIGYLVGKFALGDTQLYYPKNIIDRKAFITVGSIHNFGYLGGLLGIIAGIVYQLKQRKKTRVSRTPPSQNPSAL